MGRKPTGDSARERARQLLEIATTADQVRTAQAVLLPLEFDLSLDETAQIIGKTRSWVARARRRFISAPDAPPAATRGGRRNAILSEEDEIYLVKRAVVRSNRIGGLGVHGELKVLLVQRGHAPSPSTVTGIMQRVVDQIMPGQKASYLTENCPMLASIWSREMQPRQRSE